MYNLRSAKKNTIELPVEIQLTGDKNNPIVSDIENSMSDSDVSVSDLDCSGLINDSEEVSSPVTVNNSAGSSQTASNCNFDNSDPNMQQLINARILEQLDKIGQRLDRIENKECKKTADKSKILQVKL